MTSTEQPTLALYACRECGAELEYQGVGRPPVYCLEHRPTSFPALRGTSPVVERRGHCRQCGVEIAYGSRGRPKKYCDRCGYHGPAWDYRRMEHFTILDSEIRRLIQRYNGQCAYCRAAPHEQLDHVVAVSRGGRHSIGNLLPSCAACNNSKGPRFLAEWRRRKRGAVKVQQVVGKVNRALTALTANTVGPSHHGDPDTSRQAARRNALRSGSQRVRVLLALAERASTDWELELKLGLKHSSVGTRRGELVAIGLVEKTEERRFTDTGSTAVVWRCTPAGIELARELRA